MFIIRFAAKALTNLKRKETKNEISTETQKHIERTYGRVFCVYVFVCACNVQIMMMMMMMELRRIFVLKAN